MQHALPKSAGHRTRHTRWSFHLKGSLGSHLGLRNPIRTGHVLDSQHFEFLGNALPTIALAGPGEPNNPRYAFPTAYRDAKVYEH